MSRATAGLIISLVGSAVVLVFALADVIGLGSGSGFGYRQVIGVIVGGAVTLAGLFVMALSRRAAR